MTLRHRSATGADWSARRQTRSRRLNKTQHQQGVQGKMLPQGAPVKEFAKIFTVISSVARNDSEI